MTQTDKHSKWTLQITAMSRDVAIVCPLSRNKAGGVNVVEWELTDGRFIGYYNEVRGRLYSSASVVTATSGIHFPISLARGALIIDGS